MQYQTKKILSLSAVSWLQAKNFIYTLSSKKYRSIELFFGFNIFQYIGDYVLPSLFLYMVCLLLLLDNFWPSNWHSYHPFSTTQHFYRNHRYFDVLIHKYFLTQHFSILGTPSWQCTKLLKAKHFGLYMFVKHMLQNIWLPFE